MTPHTRGAMFKHGHNGYANYGCRCEVCRAGNSAYMLAWFHASPERMAKKAATQRSYWARCKASRSAEQAPTSVREPRDGGAE